MFLQNKRNGNHWNSDQFRQSREIDKDSLAAASAPNTVLAILGFNFSYMFVAKSGKPAPNADRTTVEMASAEAAYMRYASMI